MKKDDQNTQKCVQNPEKFVQKKPNHVQINTTAAAHLFIITKMNRVQYPKN